MARPAVAIMQPTFLPWQGYFAMLDAADLFVFLDDVQFRPRSWHSRNRLFVGGGEPRWVSLPVRGENGSSRADINRMLPRLDDNNFRRKTIATLRQSYGGSPHYVVAGTATEAWLEREWRTLADVNIAWIDLAAELLGISTPTLRCSDIGAQGTRSALIADILRRLDAHTYLSAAGSADYMVNDAVFPLDDVEVRFQAYEPQPYDQVHSQEFVPFLSTLDALLQIGADRAAEVVRAGARPWITWDEMEARVRP